MIERILDNTALMTAAIAGLYGLLLVGGLAVPLRKSKRSLKRRLAVNLVLSALSLTTAWLVIRPVVAMLLEPTNRHWGLLDRLNLSPLWAMVIGFLLMDLSFYYWHRLNHLWPLLWRFHNVHHVDGDMDVTTSLRFHPAETAYSVAFRAVQISLIGVSPLLLVVYEFAFLANTLFQHGNVRLPMWLERGLNWFIVTPRMHGIHHSMVMAETNSNYSSVFRWWDQIHGTLVLKIPQEKIAIGVAGYSGPESESVPALLALPFGRQRNYWRFADGRAPARQFTGPQPARWRLPVALLAIVAALGLLAATSAAPRRADASNEQRASRIEQLYRQYRSSFPEVPEMSAEELLAAQATGNVVLVDVRRPVERDVSMIPGAISREQFEQQRDLIGDKTIVIYCTIGERSGRYAKAHQAPGRRLVNLAGGILAWAHAGQPLVNRDGPTRRVHVYGPTWDLLPRSYEAVW